MYWEGWMEGQSVMGNLMASTHTVRGLIDDPTNTTLLQEITAIWTQGVTEDKLEHMLIVNATNHVIWSANPGSQLVGAFINRALTGWGCRGGEE